MKTRNVVAVALMALLAGAAQEVKANEAITPL